MREEGGELLKIQQELKNPLSGQVTIAERSVHLGCWYRSYGNWGRKRGKMSFGIVGA